MSKEKNKAIIASTITNYKPCSQDLHIFLETNGFYDCPASTMTSLHNAFDGGLIDHILRVTQYAVKINAMLPEYLQLPKVSVIKVCFLHSIGKVGLYTPCTSDWHRKNMGKMYEFNENIVSMTVSERSLYYISKFGDETDKLTEAEFQAIANYEKDLSSDKMAKWHSEPLAVILRQAIDLAILEEKKQIKK